MDIGGAIRERDRLTGVYSRDYFDQAARDIIDNNPDTEFAIIELDINRLTIINELYGVGEGDNVLKYMGTTLEELYLTTPNALYARIQADLFAILCPYNQEKIEQDIKYIEDSIKKYSLMLNIDILVSFGILHVKERQLDIQILRDRAKLAMKTVKGNYINHVAYYDENLHMKISNEQEVIQNMNLAFERREFCVYYQPKHNLDDNRIVGAEALVRWISPDKGMISPGVFIPIFESNGFIMKLDQYVWEEACKFIRRQLDEGINIKPVSVNISRINLYNPELVYYLDSLVKKYNVPYDMLELEFTETAYTDNPQLMLQTMASLQQLGFKVEMDDFGSGYSSLNMLKDVPVDVLKIDLNFLSKTSNPDKSMTILTSIVRMVKWLDIPSIVEGVETEEQIDYLKSIGCTMVQGYYYSKPLPEKEYVDYIKKYDDVKVTKADTTVLHKDIGITKPNEIWKMVTSQRSSEFPIFSAFALYEENKGKREPIRLSEEYYSLFGTSREESFGQDQNPYNLVVPEDREVVDRIFEESTLGHRFGEGVVRRICADGSIKHLLVKVRLLGIDASGESKFFYVGMNDLSRYVDKFQEK